MAARLIYMYYVGRVLLWWKLLFFVIRIMKKRYESITKKNELQRDVTSRGHKRLAMEVISEAIFSWDLGSSYKL